MSLIQGSVGLIYFVHEFKPKFIEAGLLAHTEQTQAVQDINATIRALAPVLNSPSVQGAVTVRSSESSVPVAAMVKTFAGATYVFAVAMRDGQTTATFHLASPAAATAEVIDENRTIPVQAGTFQDRFGGYDVHLYRVK